MAYVFANFETVSAADLKWETHNQAIICVDVWEKQDKRAVLLEKLNRQDLTAEERESIKEQIAILNESIRRRDKDGKCNA